MIAKTIEGFLCPLQGFRIILSSPKNMIYSVIPFLIGFLIVGLGYFAASEYLNPWVGSWTENSAFLRDWDILKSILDVFLIIVGWILVSLLNFLAGYLCIIIFAGPFYALMVENIFKLELPDKKPRSDFRLIVGMFFIGILKALLFLLVGIFCFLLTFVPVVNLLAPLILTLTVAFDCADYAFEVDFLKLRQRFAFFRQNFWNFFGLSLAILATGLLPGSFFILLPVFICGATKMYIQRQSEIV